MNQALQEALFQCARDAGAMGDAKLKSWSGADQADSELDFGARRVYVAVAHEGVDLETAITREDARWRAYAVEQARKVENAPKIKHGPSRGHSVISHRWVNPDGFQTVAIHIRQMVRILTEKYGET